MLAFSDFPGTLENERSPCEAVERKVLAYVSRYMWAEELIEVNHHVGYIYMCRTLPVVLKIQLFLKTMNNE